MMTLACQKCQTAWAVSDKDPELPLLVIAARGLMNCPKSNCDGQLIEAKKRARARKISATELYQASCGMGFAFERQCGSREITKLLSGATIKSISVGPSIDPHKTVLKSLTLENGKVVHIGPSTQGAVVFKITENTDGG